MTKVASRLFVSCLVLGVVLSGCKKQEEPIPEAPPLAPLASTKSESVPAKRKSTAGPLPPGTTGELPPGHPPIDMPGAGNGAMPGKGAMPGNNGMPGNDAQAGATELKEAPEQFAGIKMVAPEGWKPLKPVAPKSSGFAVAGPIALFKLEKAKDDSADALVKVTHFPGMKNIPVEAQLSRWFGQVAQPDGSSTKDVAKVESWESEGVKVSVADMTGMMGGGISRMIAAIIEHPQGPHFVKATGPVDTVEHWRESVMTYLHSATITK